MYGDYIRERLGKEVITHEHGFLIWSQYSQDAIYMEDIYVSPSKRDLSVAHELGKEICDIARSQGKKYVLGTVVPSTNGATKSLKVLLYWGMRLWKCESDLIWLVKEV